MKPVHFRFRRAPHELTLRQHITKLERENAELRREVQEFRRAELRQFAQLCVGQISPMVRPMSHPDVLLDS